MTFNCYSRIGKLCQLVRLEILVQSIHLDNLQLIQTLMKDSRVAIAKFVVKHEQSSETFNSDKTAWSCKGLNTQITTNMQSLNP